MEGVVGGLHLCAGIDQSTIHEVKFSAPTYIPHVMRKDYKVDLIAGGWTCI